LAQERPANAEVAIIAASSGFSDEPLVAIEARLDAAINALPDSVIAWSNWLIDFFKDDPESYNVLLGNDAGTALYVMRGTKTGGDPTAAEFECLKSGLQAWLSGRPICDIERALGVEPEDLGKCLRARDLLLKLASRPLYLVISAVAEIARSLCERRGVPIPTPALLEILPVAFRKGFDTPDKVAFAQARTKIRSRVELHNAFAREIGAPLNVLGRDYGNVVNMVAVILALHR
jgi:ATP-dependent RNA helicase HelY